jgi:hypothetical protein
MFMAMKREVLRVGGYTQDVFVSQTLELAAMSDVVIYLKHSGALDGRSLSVDVRQWGAHNNGSLTFWALGSG